MKAKPDTDIRMEIRPYTYNIGQNVTARMKHQKTKRAANFNGGTTVCDGDWKGDRTWHLQVYTSPELKRSKRMNENTKNGETTSGANNCMRNQPDAFVSFTNETTAYLFSNNIYQMIYHPKTLPCILCPLSLMTKYYGFPNRKEKSPRTIIRVATRKRLGSTTQTDSQGKLT